MPTLSFSHVHLIWPDGRVLLRDHTWSLPAGLTALIGRNGIGKTTLVRLACGELAPTSGRIERPAAVVHVRQDLALERGRTVAAALGVGERLAALRAIESGSTDPVHYDALGDDWTVEERARAQLDRLGLRVGLDAPVERISGGEAVLVAVGAALLARPGLMVLDEPTNNLDAGARESLITELVQRDGATLVVSHDRGLLSRVDRIAELRENDDRSADLHWFGGGLEAYEEARRTEAAVAARAATSAASAVARQQRALVAHADGAGRKRRAGERKRAERRVIGLIADAKQNQAERTDARVRAIHQRRLADARERLVEARAAIARDRSIRIDVPGTVVPGRRMVLEADGLVTRTGAVLDALVRGPERILLSGPNGAGKTTLLHTLLGEVPPRAGRAGIHVPVGILRQRLDALDALDPDGTVERSVLAAAGDASLQEVRDQLGRFQLRGAAAQAPLRTLSGGERFRASLARVLLARPAPQLLILDEPTNNLDLDAQARLVEALGGYGGALLIVSHDAAFVEAVAPTRRWTVGTHATGDDAVVDEPLD